MRSAPVLQSFAGGSGRILSLRRLWWAAIVLLGVSAGAVGFTIWQLRNDAVGAAVAEAGISPLSGRPAVAFHSVGRRRSYGGQALHEGAGLGTAQDFGLLSSTRNFRNR
jgi:hypothetical protein